MKSKFVRSADIRKFPYWPIRVEKVDRRTYKLCHDWAFMCDSGMILNVPAGFDCDGASIPRFAWPIVGFPFEFIEAAVLHEYVYAVGPAIYPLVPGLYEYLEIRGDPASFHNQGVLRHWADCMYLSALKAMGVSRVNRYAQFRAVRWFGWVIWYTKKRGAVPQRVEPPTRPDTDVMACA